MDVLLVLSCVLMFSSVHVTGRVGPIDVAVQAYWTARSGGHIEDAAAAREKARAILEDTRVEDRRFGELTGTVSLLYQNGGREAQARAVVEAALERSASLGLGHPTRVMLLQKLAELWQQDRNLLRAAVYREQVITALEAAHAEDDAYSLNSAYVDLARLYRQLGRRDNMAAVLEKLRASHGDNLALLAKFYEEDGQIDRAGATYQMLVERDRADAQAGREALQALAGFYQEHKRYDDARAALERALAIAQGAGDSDAVRDLELNRAIHMQQAGRTQAADRIFERLLTEGPDDRNALTMYTAHLSETGRGAKAASMLEQYLANHEDLQPVEQSEILVALSSAFSAAGDGRRADEYRRAWAAKLRTAHTQPHERALIIGLLQQAQAAAGRHKLDEAFRLAMEAMDKAPRATDREQLAGMLPSIATSLATEGAQDKADQLYQRALALTESWSPATLMPLMALEQSFATFLVQEKRWDELPGALSRYRDTLTTARGPGTGWMGDVLRVRLDDAASQALVALEESLSGTTSEPYLHALERRILILQDNGQADPALDLRRRSVAIADAALCHNDPQRGEIRMQTAVALARQQMFNEAAEMAAAAVAVAGQVHPEEANPFTAELREILRLMTLHGGAHR